MSRFLFVLWEGGGNVPPQLGLARRLAARGHSVRVLGERCLAGDVEAAGCRFVPFTRAPSRADRTPDSDYVRDGDARTPIGAFLRTRDRVMLGPARAHADDTLEALAREPTDVLVSDFMLTGAQAAGEHAALPTALLFHSAYMAPEPGKPAPGFGLLPGRGPFVAARDWLGVRLFRRLFDSGLGPLHATRRALGLPPIRTITDVFDRATRVLVQVTEAFELHGRTRAPNVVFVGPTVDEPAWAAPFTDPFGEDDRRPLIAVSASSQYLRQETMLSSTISALAALPVRAVVTSGPAIDPASLPRASNVVTVRSASHDALFSRAAVVVSHAGLGAVTRALLHGAPLVVAPLARDQEDVAARVLACGAGVRVRRPTPERMRAAIAHLLDDPRPRDAARAMGAHIGADVAAARGVVELEALAAR